MKLLDSRRLTGPNLQATCPVAVMEVCFDEGEDPGIAVAAWRAELARLIDAPATTVRHFRGGAALCVAVPLDELLATTDINEWALERATAIAAGRDPGPVEPRRGELALLRSAGRNPALLALAAEAGRRDLPFLWDDTEVSLGAGARSRSYPIGALPAGAEVPWHELSRIPVALITGTNGKTTCTRLLARIARCAGRAAGACSTIGISVDEIPIESGDWTGPAAARAVLRRRDVELALLETARGGILRRGLAIDSCDAALITNVSADHLGSYGVDDVATMVRVKAVVARAVRPGGAVVLNADDPALVALASEQAARIVFFSIDPQNPVVIGHRAVGGEAWLASVIASPPDGAPSPRSPAAWIVRARGAEENALLAVAEVPISFGGAAPYNVQNALAAAALASALGLPDAAIVAGLRSFDSSADDNPGRGRLIDVAGVQLLLDYGHNPEGIRAVLSLAAKLRARDPAASGDTAGLHVVLGQPGDRSDEAIHAVAGAVAAGRPSRVLVHDMGAHLRGRQLGEIPALLRRELIALGFAAEALESADDEAGAIEAALDGAHPGDLVLVLPHTDGEAVAGLLARRATSARPAGA